LSIFSHIFAVWAIERVKVDSHWINVRSSLIQLLIF
jgi:hypothetical protein